MECRKLVQAKENLLRQIEDAFSNVEHPGDDNVLMQLPPDDVDYDDLDYNAFRGLYWKEITLELICHLNIRSVLSYLTDEGFNFYLPGLMTVAINNPDQTVEMRDGLVALMTPSKESVNLNTSRYWRINSLTPKQRSAFRSYLEYMATYYAYSEIEQDALESTWWQVD
jgi:hypothetical protein